MILVTGATGLVGHYTVRLLDGFFNDVLHLPNGERMPLKVRSNESLTKATVLVHSDGIWPV
jgi:nucleoside-diphosphate-sugar epimerase